MQNPVNDGMFIISTGAGFLPLTVSKDDKTDKNDKNDVVS